MSDKKEPLRHVDKTRQDRQPVSERQRVKDWQKRIDTMKQGLYPYSANHSTEEG